MSLSYRCRWIGGAVPFKRIRYVFTEKIVSPDSWVVNSFFGIFLNFFEIFSERYIRAFSAEMSRSPATTRSSAAKPSEKLAV